MDPHNKTVRTTEQQIGCFWEKSVILNSPKQIYEINLLDLDPFSKALGSKKQSFFSKLN
jgi:hypothetical protein